MGAWVTSAPRFSISDNYITEIMSVLLGSRKPRQSVQLLALSSRASVAGLPWFGVVIPDLCEGRSVRNVERKSGPSVRLARLVSSPVRSQTIQVLTRVGVRPSPIGGIVGCRILWDDPVRLLRPKHGGTIGTVCRFPASLLCRRISS